jgi:hypothetical protein
MKEEPQDNKWALTFGFTPGGTLGNGRRHCKLKTLGTLKGGGQEWPCGKPASCCQAFTFPKKLKIWTFKNETL